MLSEPRNREQELEKLVREADEVLDVGDDSRDWETALENLIGGAAEAVFDSSDEEVAAELRSWGEDPEAVADEVRGVLLDAVDRYQRQADERRARTRELVAARATARAGRLPS